jgi:PAS domain S-box-containing protein
MRTGTEADTPRQFLEFRDEHRNRPAERSAAPRWKVLLVDDEPAVHQVTRLALDNFEFDGRALEFLHAYSAAEGEALLADSPDVAVALVDVVVETEHAGLDLVRRIREQLSNHFVRLILRTGQPGHAPEDVVIRQYEINDYKDKTELTAQKLYSTILTSLRGYRDLMALEDSRRQLKLAIESEAHFHALADDAPALIWITDARNHGTWFNRRWLEYTGRTIDDELGTGWRSGVHPDDAGRCAALRGDAIAARRRFETELRLRRADGSYGWIADTGIPRYDEQGKFMGYIGYCWDITDRKRAQAALLAAKEEAEQANRAKSEFLAHMSHELRTPMNAILGFGQVLELETQDPRQREQVGEILRAGAHLLDLIDELLDLSRIESGRLSAVIEAVELTTIIGQAVQLVEPLLARAKLALRNECARPVSAMADATRLRQILVNLLSNAVKYNRPGGSVRVSLAARDAHRLRVAIADTGPGIDADKLERLFQPFDRLGAEFGPIEGTGIGLALSRRLAHLMGATLGVESVPGKGSTFWIELPLARE